MSSDEDATFAGYHLERRIGSGGMGTVYVARHPRLPRLDAVKIMADRHSGDAGFRARFLREAEFATRVQHPNLVPVYDRGEYDGRLWISMPYVNGVDLARVIDRHPAGLGVDRAVRILTETAAGLDEVHRSGLLHRDVKPANILLAEQADGTDRVHVSDFGIARPTDDSTTLTGSGGPTGTLAYAAPEQISGGPIDRRADVYALGCTLFQMLTGSVPFPDGGPAAVMYAHLYQPPPRPSARNALVPSCFDSVIATALAKSPADRYPSCGALAAAAHRAATGADVSPRAGRARRGRRMVLAGAIAAALAVTVAATVYAIRTETPGGVDAGRIPRTDIAEPAHWGKYGYIAETFPALLPPSPISAGYQNITACSPEDDTDRELALDDEVAVGTLFCLGDLDPVHSVEVTCRADRQPIEPERSFATVEGDAVWTRPSGSGHLFWGTHLYTHSGTYLDGKVWGELDVYFDDANRNFCRIHVVGIGPTGAALRDRWWNDAPI
ncbi:serine/threonine-protein kinase [Nocardia huaxiensis]|uniref:serine/threonine-protein kinase n=1 Tax=Nocardia huaxiensis TaxID=2755382 RepID=UPI001FD1A594|nr:serine/threonine-protein kinase [Nocardia huaxiensis]